MNNKIIARNLLIFDQLKELNFHLQIRNIDIIILKGAALIELLPEYISRRILQDIDLIVKPENLETFRQILSSLGYSPAVDDPNSFESPSKTAPLDVQTDLWYMDKNEFDLLWQEGGRTQTSYPNVYILNTADMLIHIFAHAAVHHCEKLPLWDNDFKIFKNRFWKEIDLEGLDRKLCSYGLKETWEIYFNSAEPVTMKGKIYNYFLKSEIKDKGHLMIYLHASIRKKADILLKTMFPTRKFIEDRYSLKNRNVIVAARVLRPFIILLKIFVIPMKLIPPRANPRM